MRQNPYIDHVLRADADSSRVQWVYDRLKLSMKGDQLTYLKEVTMSHENCPAGLKDELSNG